MIHHLAFFANLVWDFIKSSFLRINLVHEEFRSYRTNFMQHCQNELTLANGLAQSLIKYGEVRLGYITAELKPYSKQQKPDLEFKDKSSGRVFFITYECLSNENISYAELLSTVKEYRAFAIDDDEIIYVYATNISVPEQWKLKFNSNKITLISDVKSSKDIEKKLYKITGDNN